eukprot:TRINITY_DN1609_c0_g1_i24.p3 TRINITY_DN1609_c0_g1~~TRINITY_DN1609_c0_g1_i24.p3  ORF type:complete len:100 (-),score=17.22 TRINITY_DN1609_c0_g1_i24:384-683(-)
MYSLYVIYISFFVGLLSTVLSIPEWLMILLLVMNVGFVAFISVFHIGLPLTQSFWRSLDTKVANSAIAQEMSGFPRPHGWPTTSEVAPSNLSPKVMESA